jgi:hypothetical protein
MLGVMRRQACIDSGNVITVLSYPKTVDWSFELNTGRGRRLREVPILRSWILPGRTPVYEG